MGNLRRDSDLLGHKHSSKLLGCFSVKMLSISEPCNLGKLHLCEETWGKLFRAQKLFRKSIQQ